MNKRWIISPVAPDRMELARQLDVPPIVAQLLVNRGITNEKDGRSFLSPQLKDLISPSLLPGAVQAADQIVNAIDNNTRIVLYGDYDVDGITGVTALWQMLRHLGADVTFYVPHRLQEGYGLNVAAVTQLVRDGAGLIISVDCGITAIDAAHAIRECGAQLIVTDHHTPRAELPDAAVIVHPTVGGECPNPNLSGAGVAFKLAWAIAQRKSGGDRVSAESRVVLMELLPLIALGTIADVVPLTGENRAITRHGLQTLPQTRNPGLRALVQSAGLNGSRISGYDVGFKLAPRINAAGRMGHARLAVELFTRANDDRAREITLYLEEHNRARQTTERRTTKQAMEMIEQGDLASDAHRAIVVAHEGWHPGVIGIVAARIVDRFHRPTLVISLAGSEGQGSGRSIASFDIVDALGACAEFLLDYGGHSMAAGVRIHPDQIAAFADRFTEIANNRLTGNDLVPKLRLDSEVTLEELSLATTEMILSLGPFGPGNPRPKLSTDWVELADEPRCVGSRGDHLQATFRQNGTVLRAIGFGLHSHMEDLKAHRRCRVAFEPIINDFRGRRSVEMQILDLRFPTSATDSPSNAESSLIAAD